MSTRRRHIECYGAVTGSRLASFRTIRAGVIPYRVDPLTGDLSFLLARHGSSKELGDFGGGVRKNESALQAAFREFAEETLGVFSDFYSQPEDLGLCPTFVDGRSMSVIFAPVPFDFDVEKHFGEARKKNHSSSVQRKAFVEISDVVWTSNGEFRKLIQRSDT